MPHITVRGIDSQELRGMSTELKKVHWPDKEKVVKYTGVVFSVVVVLGAVIWVLDTAFSGVISLIVG